METPSEKSLSNFFHGRIFQIPEYQRFYSWEDRQCQDLWDDLEYLLEQADPPDHYFGTIVILDSDETVEPSDYKVLKKWDVIDGQQRLTTIAILLKVLLRRLKKLEENSGPITNIEEKYLKVNGHLKIQLQPKDRSVFEQILEKPEKWIGIDSSDMSEFKVYSQERLVKAYEFFEDKMDELEVRIEEDPDREIKKVYSELLRLIQEKLKPLVRPIEPGREERASQIFELVNSRGKDLSELEKTKSYLMHAIYKYDLLESEEIRIEDIHEDFGRIYVNINNLLDKKWIKRKNIGEEDIQTYHYVWWYTDWRTRSDNNYKNLLPSLKKHLSNKIEQDKSDGASVLKNYSDTLSQTYEDFLKIVKNTEPDTDDKIGRILNRLHSLPNSARLYPLILYAWRELKGDRENELKDFFKQIENMWVRSYGIVDKKPIDKGKFYVRARNLSSGDWDWERAKEWFKEEAKEQVGGTPQFEDILVSDEFYNRANKSQAIKYLLFCYERYSRFKETGEIGTWHWTDLMKQGAVEIEHILPQSPEEHGWNKVFSNPEEWMHRIGNLTLIKKRENNEAKNYDFDSKKRAYDAQPFFITKRLVRKDKWTESEIEERGKKIISFSRNFWNPEKSVLVPEDI